MQSFVLRLLRHYFRYFLAYGMHREFNVTFDIRIVAIRAFRTHHVRYGYPQQCWMPATIRAFVRRPENMSFMLAR